MGKKVDQEAVAKEASNLKRLLGDRNRSVFGRQLNPKMSRAMIYQHESGERPISLQAAKAYAEGFNVPLREISERWASEFSSDSQPTADRPPVYQLETAQQPPYTQRLIQFASSLSEQHDEEAKALAQSLDLMAGDGRAMGGSALLIGLFERAWREKEYAQREARALLKERDKLKESLQKCHEHTKQVEAKVSTLEAALRKAHEAFPGVRELFPGDDDAFWNRVFKKPSGLFGSW